jgi:hypothetical protein
MNYADRFAQAIEEKFNSKEAGPAQYRMTVVSGRKFDKIVMETRYSIERGFTGGSVHAFVEKATGLLQAHAVNAGLAWEWLTCAVPLRASRSSQPALCTHVDMLYLDVAGLRGAAVCFAVDLADPAIGSSSLGTCTFFH